jgi:hypothetical protein
MPEYKSNRPSMMLGRTYMERGKPVTVLIRWQHSAGVAGGWVTWHRPPKPHAPRNVAIERGDGSRDIRPFRGLRKPKEDTP